MYIPPYYKENDEARLQDFIQAHHFATLVSAWDHSVTATHLPFVLKKKDGKTYLVTHMARANPQWKHFSTHELLVIFQGPHAYISPSHYELKQNVPTWNYIAVHAYGKATILDDREDALSILETMIQTFEPAYYDQWKQLSPEYVNAMLKGIVSFEIEVSRMEGKFKLSQNKTKNEQHNIIEALEKSNASEVSELAGEMKKNIVS